MVAFDMRTWATLAIALALSCWGVEARAEGRAPAESFESSQPLRVGLLVFEGDGPAVTDMRARVQTALVTRGFEVKRINRSLSDAAERVACPGPANELACVERIARYINLNSSTTGYDYLIWARFDEAEPEPEGLGPGVLVVYDVLAGELAFGLELTGSADDSILPEVLAPAVAERLDHHRDPPPGPSEAELEILATLDDPPPPDWDDCVDCGYPGWQPVSPIGCAYPMEPRFEDWCRVGPRDDAAYGVPDRRPVCKRGPVFGYFRPRSWALVGVTGASLVGTGVALGLAANAPRGWSADHTRGVAITGYSLIGASAALVAALTWTILADRREAKMFMREQSELRVLSLRWGP
ncbi:hypothetical protein PPSIR1_27028 [Plesiocystis pacifica SIR-1]|uniref:Uncharacterized protein n=1 Tax=Plesiocystis pacifica SIR-1 TaxID=391625 RepID=A6GDA9_9BACT|nr:hypothetical protein [Plesiocystis pacifica]EDM76184.1 hypothetical protein PPSIR1_27028 [Plesiocystis pacifica SIR-1]